MKKIIFAIAAGFASVLTCVGAASAALAPSAALAAPAPSAALAARLPVVYSQPGWMGPQRRPAHFYTITGDSSEWLNTAHWRHWTAASAYSSGQYAYRSCFGSCDKIKKVRAAITLWRVRTHKGTRYFTRLKWAYTIKGRRQAVIAWFDPSGRAVLWVRHK